MIRLTKTGKVLLLLLATLTTNAISAADVHALHQQGNYTAAAEVGLSMLLREPWNHELRFLVADSLERSGDTNAAQAQFQTLAGTAYAEAAKIRLNSLLTAAGASATGKVMLAASGSTFSTFDVPARPLAIPSAATEATPPPRNGGLRDEIKLAPRAAEIETVHQLNADGKYRAAAKQGKQLIERGDADDEIRLIVANSLAWTGQLDEAIPVYQNIIRASSSAGSVNNARAGMGNALRWKGRDDQAAPLYKQALADDPKHEPSLEGLVYAERELRPKTTITLGNSDDSSNMNRRSAIINHRWRDSSQQQLFELELGNNRDDLAGNQASQQDFTVRYQALAVPLKPRFSLSAQASPGNAIFGGIQLELVSQKLTLDAEHMNWGLNALNTRALKNGLSANRIGLSGKTGTDFGDFSAAVNYYDISDTNTILTSNVRYTAPWRWIGLKAFLGAETRDPKFNSLDYWSPAQGYGSTYLGLQGDWSKERWELFASGQAGKPLYGDAGDSWSLSGGGRLWLDRRFAIGLRQWQMSSWRDNAKYRANATTVTLESLW